MAITLETNARNAAAEAVGTLLNGGTIEFQTSADAEVATIGLAATAFGSASDGTITANTMTADSDVTGGTTTKFVAKTSGGAAVFGGTVGTSGADINLTDVTFGAGGTLTLTAFTYTQPAS